METQKKIIYRSEKTKKSAGYLKFAVKLSSVMAVFIIGFLVFLWNFLASYEKSNPSYYTDNLISVLEKGDYKKAAEMLSFEESEFFNFNHRTEFIQHIVGGKEDITVSKVKSESKDVLNYIVKGENGNIPFSLTKEENSLPFNMSGYSISLNLEKTSPWKIAVSDTALAVKVNGVSVTDKYLSSETSVPYSYKTLNNNDIAPKLKTYIIDGLYTPPQITCDNGKIFTDPKNRTVFITLSSEISEELKTLVENSAVTYAKFISNDVSRTAVMSMIYKDTHFYASVANFSPSWYVDHDSAQAENIEIFDYTEYSPDAFSVQIKFDYRIKQSQWNINKVYPTHYRMSFAKIDGQFKIINIEVI